MERSWEREGDSLPRHHRRQGSATTTPTPSRPPSRRSSPHPTTAPSISPSRSSLSSSKTVVNTKSLSSASSGYNSLPRSTKSPKTSRQSSATPTPKSSPVHSASNPGTLSNFVSVVVWFYNIKYQINISLHSYWTSVKELRYSSTQNSLIKCLAPSIIWLLSRGLSHYLTKIKHIISNTIHLGG